LGYSFSIFLGLMLTFNELVIISIVKMLATQIFCAITIADITRGNCVHVVTIVELMNKSSILKGSSEGLVPFICSDRRRNIESGEFVVVGTVFKVEVTFQFFVCLCKRKVVSFVGIEDHLGSAVDDMTIIDTVGRIVAAVDAARTGGNGRSTVLDEKRSCASAVKNKASEIDVQMAHKDCFDLCVVLAHDRKELISGLIVHTVEDRAVTKNVETLLGIGGEDVLEPGQLASRISLLGSESIELDVHASVDNNDGVALHVTHVVATSSKRLLGISVEPICPEGSNLLIKRSTLSAMHVVGVHIVVAKEREHLDIGIVLFELSGGVLESKNDFFVAIDGLKTTAHISCPEDAVRFRETLLGINKISLKKSFRAMTLVITITASIARSVAAAPILLGIRALTILPLQMLITNLKNVM